MPRARVIWLCAVLAAGCTKADRHGAAPPVAPMPLPPITHPAPETAGWFELLSGSLVSAKVDHALYEAPGQVHFYVHFRLENPTGVPVGVDLRYFEALYPNQWGWSDRPQRDVIDEVRAMPQPLKAAEQVTLIADFKAGLLKLVPPHGHLDFYRDFNASGRAEVDKQPMKFLLIAIDGQVRASDGENAEQLRIGDDEAKRVLVVPAPLAWGTVPPGAITLTDR